MGKYSSSMELLVSFSEKGIFLQKASPSNCLGVCHWGWTGRDRNSSKKVDVCLDVCFCWFWSFGRTKLRTQKKTGSAGFKGGGNSNVFCVHPYSGKWSNLTDIVQMSWNHQLENKHSRSWTIPKKNFYGWPDGCVANMLGSHKNHKSGFALQK